MVTGSHHKARAERCVEAIRCLRSQHIEMHEISRMIGLIGLTQLNVENALVLLVHGSSIIADVGSIIIAPICSLQSEV